MTVADSRGLRARLYTDTQAFEALRARWDALLAASPTATPWQTWDFCSRWWQHVGARKALLRLIVVEDQGTPCLLLPLQIGVSRRGMRWLEPLGMPEDIHRPRLALGPLRAAAMHCALELAWQWHDQWDALRVDEKTPEDPEVEFLRQFAGAHALALRRAILHPCPVLLLDRPWNDYLASRSAALRQNLRRSRRQLEKIGALQLTRYCTADEVMCGLQTFLEVEARSWKRAAGIGLEQSAEYREFYRGFVAAMAARGRARALALSVGGRPIAATVAFCSDDTYYSAQIAHDAAFAACSPGTLLEALELEGLMSESRWRVYDPMGGALANKRRWIATMPPTYRIMISGRSARARLFDAYYFGVKPLLKRIKNPFRSQPASLP